MRVFVWFLLGISLSVGDKLDRTYLPPPGFKLSGGNDVDLHGPLDYSTSIQDQPTFDQEVVNGPDLFRPEGLNEGSVYEMPLLTSDKKIPTSFGSRRPLDRVSQTQNSFSQDRKAVSFDSNRPIEESQAELELKTNEASTGSVDTQGSQVSDQLERDSLSRLPILNRYRPNSTGPTSPQRDFTMSVLRTTAIPTRFATADAPKDSEYSFENTPKEIKNIDRPNTSGTEAIYRQTIRPNTFSPKERIFNFGYRQGIQTQEPANREINLNRQESQTIKQNTFSPKERIFNFGSKPSRKPDVSRIKSGRPTFGGTVVSTPKTEKNDGINDFSQYTTSGPQAQDYKFEENLAKPFKTESPASDDDVLESDNDQIQEIDGDRQTYRTENESEKRKSNAKTYSSNNVPSTYKQNDRPQAESERNAVIINYDNDITPEGNFAYSYDTSNGIHADENGTASDGVKAQGQFSYTGDDGKFYSIIYSADENGFQPKGDHLPTPPPIPDAILKVIEQALRDKEAGISNDGSYDETKYGFKKYADATRRPQYNKKFETQDGFVKTNTGSVKQSNQNQYEPNPDKEYDTDDNKDYLDVEKVDDDEEKPVNELFETPLAPKTYKTNEKPSSPQKLKENKYFTPSGPTAQTDDNDNDSQELITDNGEREYISKDKNVPNRRGPSSANVNKAEKRITDGNQEYQSSGKKDKINERTSYQTKPEEKSNHRRPYFDSDNYDDTQKVTEADFDVSNASPDSFVNTQSKYNRGQATPAIKYSSQSNRGGLHSQNDNKPENKYNKPENKFVYTDETIKYIPIGQEEDSKDFGVKEDYQLNPTQGINESGNIQVDDFVREIPKTEIKDDTDLETENGNEELNSTKATVSDALNQQKVSERHHVPSRVNQYQGSGYDYIPPRNKFIQESSKIPTKYSDVKASSIDDIPSVEEDIVSLKKLSGENKLFKDRIPTRPSNISSRPSSLIELPISTKDDEFDFEKNYPTIEKESETSQVTSTSTKRPFYVSKSRTTSKPTQTTQGFYDDVQNVEDRKQNTGDRYNVGVYNGERQDTPRQSFVKATSTIPASKPQTNQGLRRPSYTRDRVPSTTYRPIFSVSVTGSTLEPTSVFEHSTFSSESPVFSGNVKTFNQKMGPQKITTGGVFRKPVNKFESFTPEAEANRFVEAKQESQSPVKSVTDKQKYFNENLNIKLSTLRPVEDKMETSDQTIGTYSYVDGNGNPQNVAIKSGDRLSYSRPKVNRLDKEVSTKITGEDFSGRQQPQYYDPETGYHY